VTTSLKRQLNDTESGFGNHISESGFRESGVAVPLFTVINVVPTKWGESLALAGSSEGFYVRCGVWCFLKMTDLDHGLTVNL